MHRPQKVSICIDRKKAQYVYPSQKVTIFIIPTERISRDHNKKNAVITTHKTNKCIRYILITEERILITVVIQFTAPKIEENTPH